MPRNHYVREVRLSYGVRTAAAPGVLSTPKGVADYYRERIGADPREHILAIYLDGRHRPIGDSIVSIGSATESLAHPREVFQPALMLAEARSLAKPAIRAGAVALVLAHHHPSGDPSPSPEDYAITRRLVAVGALIGVLVLDHVVVGDTSHASIRDLSVDIFSVRGDR